MRTLVTALFLSASLTTAAAAQDRSAPATPAPDVSYTFGDHDVDGGRYTQEGTLVETRGPALRRTLVRPRVHFVPELLKSVERL